MIGIEDPIIWSAYLLCILTTAVCVVYSIVNWNSGDESPSSKEDIKGTKIGKEREKGLSSD